MSPKLKVYAVKCATLILQIVTVCVMLVVGTCAGIVDGLRYLWHKYGGGFMKYWGMYKEWALALYMITQTCSVLHHATQTVFDNTNMKSFLAGKNPLQKGWENYQVIAAIHVRIPICLNY